MTVLSFVGVLAFTILWVVLPLLPALRELYAPSDVEPLSMVGRDNADIARFARHFRDYIQANLQRLPPDAGSGTDFIGKLPDGTGIVHVVASTEGLPVAELPAGAQERIVVLEQSAELPGREQFQHELWARRELAGGPGATYRAILGERSVSLADGSVVVRWLHSVGSLTVGDNAHLYGRCSSEARIKLGRLVGFDRLGAPAIIMGSGSPLAGPPQGLESMPAFERPERARDLGDAIRVEDDCIVPPGVLVKRDLVVAGSLQIGIGARIEGSVKAHGEILVASGAVVVGSVVSRKDITVGQECWVRGPLISEEHLRIARGTMIGSLESPTTIVGRTVALALGTTVHGQVIAEEGGQTED